ncbi:hypothetical protein LIER_30878 [Lithospermum erythrorhizon]|uniref:Secreted protein n=1 Tax=Lithospermum erythrorhizon TaxID=34254 RepID=A0AAV3RR13_LITER
MALGFSLVSFLSWPCCLLDDPTVEDDWDWFGFVEAHGEQVGFWKVPNLGSPCGYARFDASGFMIPSGHGSWARDSALMWLMCLIGLDLAL